ncbi:flavin reductase family protein [Corynebacterium incognita]|uniref:Flavin reductase family protein n=1 Tax=Corynebacterium incognita TaxID=2754725 RepID=A0A7G7CMV7_9CORY|nr:flavin reductase family protein [Corynebacterium incognita]QNE88923.1 flavin reductase family protein [Corynebacterium incognita]
MNTATTQSLDPRSLRHTFAAVPTGVALTAGTLDDAPVGLLTNSFATISLDPPLVSISFDLSSTSWPRLRTVKKAGISILSEDNEETAALLRRPTAERFDDIDVEGRGGSALFIPGAAAKLEVELEEVIEAGDHHLTLWRVLSHERRPDATPLVFYDSTMAPLAI